MLTSLGGVSMPLFIRSSRSTPPAFTTAPLLSCESAPLSVVQSARINRFMLFHSFAESCLELPTPPPVSSAWCECELRWRCGMRCRWPRRRTSPQPPLQYPKRPSNFGRGKSRRAEREVREYRGTRQSCIAPDWDSPLIQISDPAADVHRAYRKSPESNRH